MGINKEDAIKIKSFVKSLPEEQQIEFKSKYDAADELGKARVAGRILSTLAQKQAQEFNDNVGLGVGAATTLGLTSAAAFGAYKAGRAAVNYATAPSKLLKPIDAQLEGVRSNYPTLQDTRTQDLPALLGQKSGELSKRLKSVETNVGIAKSKLTQRLTEFNKGVLAGNLDDLAFTAKTGMPKLLNSAYEDYGAGLKGIEDFMATKNVSINNQDLAKLVGDIKNSAIRSGLDESKLGNLVKLENQLAPQGLDIKKNIPFSKAKKIIDNIINVADSDTAHIAKSGWGNLLEKYPTEVSDKLEVMNKNYSKFANLRAEINRFAKPKSGEYNIKGFKDFFIDYTKNMAQSDKNSLIKMLTEGEGVVAPIEGLKGKVEALGGLTKQKATLEEALSNVAKFSLKRRQEIAAKIESMAASTTKSEQLLSQKAALIEKFPIRLAGKEIASKMASSAIRGAIFKGLGSFGAGIFDQGWQNVEKTTGVNPLELIDKALGKPLTPEQKLRLKDMLIA